MRVAMFTQWWTPEPEYLPASLAMELVARGHEIDVITGFPNYPTGNLYPGYRLRWRQIEDSSNPRVVRVPLYPSHDRSAIRRSTNYISFGVAASTIGLSAVRPVDVAYVRHPPITSAWPARILRAWRKVPFVLHVFDMWPESVTNSGMVGSSTSSEIVGRLLNRSCLAAYRAAAEIIVISPGFKGMLVARGVPAEKITVVYNWADDSVHKPTGVDSASRAKLGGADRRVMLYAGNLGDYQGLDVAVRVVASLEQSTNLDLVLMGDGVARPDLEKLVAELGTRNVRLMPAVSSKEAQVFQASADALLITLADLPFFAATIPSKTQVALAVGKPVVISVRGDASELVRAANAGIIASLGENGLRDALIQLAALSNSELTEFGARGRAYYEQHLALNHAAAEIDRVLAKAIKHDSPHGG